MEENLQSVKKYVTVLITPALLMIVMFFLNRLIVSIDQMNATITDAIIDIRVMENTADNHERRILNLETYKKGQISRNE